MSRRPPPVAFAEAEQRLGLRFDKKLGRGVFGDAYVATVVRGGRREDHWNISKQSCTSTPQVAVKVITYDLGPNGALRSEGQAEMVRAATRREIDIMTWLHQQRVTGIVQLHEVHEQESDTCVRAMRSD